MVEGTYLQRTELWQQTLQVSCQCLRCLYIFPCLREAVSLFQWIGLTVYTALWKRANLCYKRIQQWTKIGNYNGFQHQRRTFIAKDIVGPLSKRATGSLHVVIFANWNSNLTAGILRPVIRAAWNIITFSDHCIRPYIPVSYVWNRNWHQFVNKASSTKGMSCRLRTSPLRHINDKLRVRIIVNIPASGSQFFTTVYILSQFRSHSLRGVKKIVPSKFDDIVQQELFWNAGP